MLKEEIKSNIGEKDLQHLKQVVFWTRVFTILGYATAWIPFNFFSAVLISLGNFARWTMIIHHVTHRGYDKIKDVPKRFYKMIKISIGQENMKILLDNEPLRDTIKKL